ncbi:MAG: RsmB/NOP family class I SAM-dependent RNA methyltransferase [Verrucomicrobiaceae bacterium]
MLHYNVVSQLVEALGDVFVHGYYVDKVLMHRFKDHPKWGARDRKQFAETYYEIVRWWRWHWYLAGLPDEDCLVKEKITRERAWLVFGAYWVTKTTHVPDFSECSSLNADHVRFRGETQVAPAIRASIPDWLNAVGKEELSGEWPDLLRALNRPAEVFLRTNTTKIQPKPLAINLIQEEIDTMMVPGLPDALKLIKRQSVFGTNCFKAGLFEVQDGASQMVAPFLQVEPGMRVIDACAGAGGKTLHLACLMKNKGLIQAMDLLPWKLDELRKRFRRNEITCIQPELITSPTTIVRFNKKADRVLLDVPCSGLGVLRRNPDTKWKLSPGELDRLRGIQADILKNYSTMTKPGGKLVYATCSVLPSENQDQVKRFLDEHQDEWILEEEKSWTPNVNGFDGFYAARLARKA